MRNSSNPNSKPDMGRKVGSANIPNARKNAIHDMSRIGIRVKDIAKFYNMSRPTVSNIIRRITASNCRSIPKKQGRPLILDDRGTRLLRKCVMQNCFQSLHTILARFNHIYKYDMSICTIRRYIHKLGLNSFISRQKPFISKKNLRSRLNWAHDHKNWTDLQWKTVLFTDESCFSVRPMKNRLKVWKKKGQDLAMKHIVPTFKSGYLSVSVWGGFSSKGRTPLVGTIGSFDSNTYRSIIDNHILPFMEEKHGGVSSFVLQEDNCGAHRALSIASYFKEKGVARMEWPAQSPDLNPIENVWGLMKQNLRSRTVHPSSPTDLFRILNDIWRNLPDSYFESLIESMPRRARLVHCSKGCSIKY